MERRLNLVRYGGAGRPLLLVHGMGGHAGWWRDAGPLLAGAAAPVAMDFSGHGDSEWRAEGDYSTEAWVADIEQARRQLGWERFTLVGHSLGARLSLEYAAVHPDRLQSLVVIDFLPEFVGGRFSRSRRVPQPYYQEEEDILARFRLQPDGTVLGADRLRELAHQSIRRTDRGWTWKYDWRAFRYAYLPIWDVLPHIKTRTLVLRGAHSGLMTPELLTRVARGLLDGAEATVPGAHHHVPLDAPAELSAAVLGFLG